MATHVNGLTINVFPFYYVIMLFDLLFDYGNVIDRYKRRSSLIVIANCNYCEEK